MNKPTRQFESGGFSLVEMAVVLVILGFVISALLLPVSGQRDQAYRTQTDNQLEVAKKALLGFAQTHGRLPCPATSVSAGLEAPINGSTASVACTTMVGFLPAATLGIQPVNAAGYAVDGWNNEIRYAVTASNADASGGPDFTTMGEMNKVTISSLATTHFIVCDNSTICPATYLTNNAVAVIYSTGKNGPNGVGADESGNLDGDTIFYSRTPTETVAAGGVFDDQVIWISPFVLYNAMINAGQLH
jgi:prepilin-type N-terminal cleavage/methylation domain-containing protein